LALRGANRGGRWERLALPDPEADIWSITVDPTDRRTIYAGCGPVGVYHGHRHCQNRWVIRSISVL